jgi:copper chaperone CopZ
MSIALTLRVTGMTCEGCENAVKRTLTKLPGVKSVVASHAQQSVRVDYESASVTPDAIRAAIRELGYDVQA